MSVQEPGTRGRVKGVALRHAVEWYLTRFDRERLEAMVTGIDERFRGALNLSHETLGILQASWYPAELLHALLDQTSAGLSPAQCSTLIRSAARTTAGDSMSGVYKTMLRIFASPELYAKHAQRLWNAYYDNGLYEVRVVSATEHEIRVSARASHHPLLCDSMLGSGPAIYEAFGCRSPMSERLICVSQGEPACVFRMTWVGR
jgi:hypothetical protein